MMFHKFLEFLEFDSKNFKRILKKNRSQIKRFFFNETNLEKKKSLSSVEIIRKFPKERQGSLGICCF